MLNENETHFQPRGEEKLTHFTYESQSKQVQEKGEQSVPVTLLIQRPLDCTHKIQSKSSSLN